MWKISQSFLREVENNYLWHFMRFLFVLSFYLLACEEMKTCRVICHHESLTVLLMKCVQLWLLSLIVSNSWCYCILLICMLEYCHCFMEMIAFSLILLFVQFSFQLKLQLQFFLVLFFGQQSCFLNTKGFLISVLVRQILFSLRTEYFLTFFFYVFLIFTSAKVAFFTETKNSTWKIFECNDKY